MGRNSPLLRVKSHAPKEALGFHDVVKMAFRNPVAD
jgi:hypothetical protein